MSTPWTTCQREWLRVLGHPVLVLAGGEPGRPEDEVDGKGAGEDAANEASAPPAPPPTPGPRMTVPKPPMKPVVADIPATPAAVAGGVQGRMGDRLYRALLRATARRTPHEGEALLQTIAFDLDALRADPARKRALWSQLRAARKAGRA
ncbi:hypothetical protein [Marilutibacter chinensis]|uniref:Uncharacterized protein n=1 Tax=Marilutibacter chinensis TaxID=2912247 RepID=A0ABS9HT75_9GAMM|nr:hypothetical protein [Lysobacter chinensis]MCF7221287.1 hypothetical protein [Lysobacter chinensis]